MPEVLAHTYERWNRASRPAQVASHWNPKAWSRQLPQYASFFDDLGTDHLNRVEAVEKAPVVVDENTAVEVFLLAMLWGYGPVGYGPFRTRRILDRPEAKSELLEVARVAHQEGGLAAFELVAARRRASTFLKWLGPAFGTKYIYFLTAKDRGSQPAPVMDAVIYRWFRKHTPDRPLRVGYWDSASYRRFLDSLAEWAQEIGHRYGHEVGLDDVEYLIFAEGSRFEGNEWSESWEAEQHAATPALLFDQLRALASSSIGGHRVEDLIGELESLLVPSDDDDANVA